MDTADASPKKIPQPEEVAPESAAGCLSRALFLWVIPFVRKASVAVKKKQFTAALLPPIPADNQPMHNIQRLKRMWAAEVQKKGDKASLGNCVFWFMSGRLICCTVMMVIQALLMMSAPVLLRTVIRSTQGLEKPEIGYMTCGLLIVVSSAAAILQQLSWHLCCRCAMQVWMGLSGIIFEKPARLSSGNRSNITEGELVSMMSQDAQQVLQLMAFFSLIISAPIYILVPSIILPFQLGWSFIPAFVLIMMTSTIVERISNVQRILYLKKMKQADHRNTRLNESFQGIRTIKLNAWEPVMERRIQEERDKEIAILRKVHYLTGSSQAISFGLPACGIVLTFILYAADGGDMDASKIFMCVGLFMFLCQGAQFMPHGFNMTRMMRASMARIQKLVGKEDDFTFEGDTTTPPGTVRCAEASFRWKLTDPGEEEAPATVSNISLEASPGEMIAICGRVGAGKTTLAGSLLGLVSRTAGTVSMAGSVAYVPQLPQIMNETIRENILFGTDMDEEWYQQVLEACALNQDLKQFADGDKTEIGERGITISGGQKQRIAIARAAYSQANVIVFDDPLSAMDAHVGRLVFDKCFLKLLKGSTIIFCTNQLQFCEYAARVYMLENGKITESGGYQELSSRSPAGPFATFLQSIVGVGSDEVDSQADTKEPSEEVDEIDPTTIQTKVVEAKSELNMGEKQAPKAPEKQEAPQAVKQDGDAKKGGTAGGTKMSKEIKIEGGISVSDWMQVGKAANSKYLAIGVLFFSALTPVCQYAVNFMLSRWTDNLLDDGNKPSGEDPLDDLLPIYLYCGAAAFFVFSLVSGFVLSAVYFLRCSRVLHGAMVTVTLRQRMDWFDTTPVGRILNRFGNDVMNLDLMMPRLFNMWSVMFFGVMVMVILAGIFAPPACLLSILLVACVIVLKKHYVPIALDTQRVQMMALSPLLAAQSGFLGAMDTIRCFKRVDIFVARFYEQQGGFIRAYYWNFVLDRLVQTFFATGLASLFFGCVAALLLTFGIYDTPFSALASPGSTGVVLSSLCQLSQQAPMMIFMTTRLEQAMAAVQRIVEYKDTPTEDARQATIKPVPASWPQEGALKLEGVSMRYQPDLPLALKGINLEVKPGEKVGIVGRTGSGKSSIVLTCFRMVDCAEGKVVLDSQDLGEAPLSEGRGRIGVIPQDSWLFSGTIRSNLDVWGQKSDEELWTVLRHAQLETQIRGLEGGLEHEVKEKGENLSAGTAQLLCLARVLIKQPKVLFMDEATASVDTETDQLVQQTIREKGVLPPTCSIVTVAHRIHTVIDYDRIVVLSEGHIVEEGPPDKLLDDDASYLSHLVHSTGAAGARELRRRSILAASERNAAEENRLIIPGVIPANAGDGEEPAAAEDPPLENKRLSVSLVVS